MLEDKIMQDYKQAMIDKDKFKSSVLSFLRANLKNCSIEKRKDKLSDDEVMSVIKKQVKQRQDSIDQFKKGNRLDLVDKETKEQDILKTYLPEMVPEDQLRVIVEEVINSLEEPVSMKVMGKIIKEVMAKAGAGADGKLVSDIIKKRLSANDSK